MLGDLQDLCPSNESVIEKWEKSPNQSNDKVMGQSSQMKPQTKRGQKKNSARNSQETWAKENQNEWKPKNMKRDKVQEMDSIWGYSQAWEATKMVLDEVKSLTLGNPLKNFIANNILRKPRKNISLHYSPKSPSWLRATT